MCPGGGDMSIHKLLFQWASTKKEELNKDDKYVFLCSDYIAATYL